MKAVRIGRKRASSGLAVHLEIDGRSCSTLRPVTVEIVTETGTVRRCRSCWTPARTAIARVLVEAARTANAKRTECNHRIVMDKIEVAARLDDLFAWFLTDAEKARDAELVARYHAPVEAVEVFPVAYSGAIFNPKPVAVPVVVEDDLLSLIDDAPAKPVKQLSRLGALAIALGGSPQGAAKARVAARLAARNYQPKAA
jgi:hypothetical protein